MKRTKDDLHVIQDQGDGAPFVVLAAGAGWEHRGRRTGDRVHVERWQRIDSVDLSVESISALNLLAQSSRKVRP